MKRLAYSRPRRFRVYVPAFVSCMLLAPLFAPLAAKVAAQRIKATAPVRSVPTRAPAVAVNDIRVNDARDTEPAAGTRQILFTVVLSAPSDGTLSVNYATADGGGTHPATGGASCDAASDYVATSGTLSFAAGERIKVVPVTVCANQPPGELAETLLLNLSNPTSGNIADAQATGTILHGGSQPGAIIITELRTSGPGGAGDDFVELYNNGDFDQDISGFGVFKMGADCNATPVLVAAMPGAENSAVTTIQGHQHRLLVGSQYTLKDYGGTNAAAGDQVLTSDLENDANVAVFSTSDVNKLSSITRYDSVGFGTNTGGVCELFREGATLAPVSGSAAEHSYFRNMGQASGGYPKDTNDNAADFLFADTQATPIPGVPQRLGAPGPENWAAPIRFDTLGIGAALLDGSKSSSQPPNRSRDFTGDIPNNSTFGTLAIRRRVTNASGLAVTRLRFRVVEVTTFPAPTGIADLRARTSADGTVGGVNDAATCAAETGSPAAPCTVTIKGLTLETPPAQPNGGGINSTLSAGTITLAQPLANNASLNVEFLLGVQQTGTFRFLVIVEALP